MVEFMLAPAHNGIAQRAPRRTTLIQPQWLIAAIVVLQPIASGARGFSEPLGQGLMLLADIMLLVTFASFWNRLTNTSLKLALGIAMIMVAATLFIPNYPFVGLISGIRKSFLILFAMIVGTFIPAKSRIVVHRSIILACTIVALYGIKQHFLFGKFDENILASVSSDKYTNLFHGQQRAFSLLSSGFHAGIVCLILAAYCIYTKVVPKKIALILLPVALTALFFTYTRTCIIIFVIMVLLRILRILRFPVLLAVPLAIGIYTVLMIADPSVVPNPFEAAISDTRFTGRSVSYTNALKSWERSPFQMVYGFGVGSAGSTQSEIFAHTGNDQIEPHNIFLKYLFEMGLLAGTAFILLISFAVFKARKNAKLTQESSFLDALIIALVVSGLSITTVEAWPANVYLFVIFGMYLRPLKKARPRAVHVIGRGPCMSEAL